MTNFFAPTLVHSSEVLISCHVFVCITASIACSLIPIPSGSVKIVQYKAPYLLSEITIDIRNKMAKAIASSISVNANTVVLSIVDASLRRRRLLQQQGVLVSAFLQDFKGSTSEFALLLTQERLNTQMAALGLKPVLLISTPEQTLTSNSSSHGVSSALIGGTVGGVLGGCVLFALIWCKVRQANMRCNKSSPELTTRQENPNPSQVKIHIFSVLEVVMV